jgi:hypothetical protein
MENLDAKIEQAVKDRDAIERHIQELQEQKKAEGNELPILSVGHFHSEFFPDSFRMIINVDKLCRLLKESRYTAEAKVVVLYADGEIAHYSTRKTEAGLNGMYVELQPLSAFIEESF